MTTKDKFASPRSRRSREGKIARVSVGARRRPFVMVLALAVVVAAALAFTGRASAADTYSPTGTIPVTVNAGGSVLSPRAIPLEITPNGSESNKVIYVSNSPERTESGTPAGNMEAVRTDLADYTHPASGNESCPLDIQ